MGVRRFVLSISEGVPVNISREQVLEAALQLPEDERLQLAGELMSSVPPDAEVWCIDDPGFLEELDRRSHDGTPSVPWSQVRSALMAE